MVETGVRDSTFFIMYQTCDGIFRIRHYFLLIRIESDKWVVQECQVKEASSGTDRGILLVFIILSLNTLMISGAQCMYIHMCFYHTKFLFCLFRDAKEE